MGQLNPVKALEVKHLLRAEKTFATLLLIYPASHRRQFASEMRQTFRDLYRDYAQGNRRSVSFWGSIVFDAAQSASREYISLMRSSRIMKTYIKKSASTKALLWGIALIAPIPLLLFISIISPRLGLQLSGAGWYEIGFIAQVVLPLIALAINVVALIRSANAKSLSFVSSSSVKRYLWTIVLICIIFAWIVFIFAPLTFGYV